MVDYIIVGGGLAGICFAERLLAENKTFVLITNTAHNSSRVAAGIYNPIILKRFKAVFEAQEQLDERKAFYERLLARMGVQFDVELPVLRKFFNPEEQNNWFVSADLPALAPFLSTKLVKEKYDGIDSPFDFGMVMQTGFVDTGALVNQFQAYLRSEYCLIDDTFRYDELTFQNGKLSYGEIHAHHVVFAEGFGLHQNPFFNYLPLDGTKGELLVIKAPGLSLNVAVNAAVFILPMGGDLFKVGATYNWDDKTAVPTAEGRQELVDKLKELITCDFEVIEHMAGVRPTVKDRKPLLGTHPIHKNLHILNGLGTRGVMLGPAMAKNLYQHIEMVKPLIREVDITRFKKLGPISGHNQ